MGGVEVTSVAVGRSSWKKVVKENRWLSSVWTRARVCCRVNTVLKLRRDKGVGRVSVKWRRDFVDRYK